MPHFDPGAHRYFGSTPRLVSSVTAQSLPFARPNLARPAAHRNTQKPTPFVIGKNERTDITKKLLKMPHYIPSQTTKALKAYAKEIHGHSKDHTKAENVFAETTLHREKVLKDMGKQKAFVRGEVEALVAIGDRHVRDPYAFTHRAEQVAGTTLRGMVKEHSKNQAQPSTTERRAAITSSSDEAPTTTSAPSAIGWKAPTRLDTNSGTATASPVVPLMGGYHADAVHADQGHRLHGSASGAQLDVLVLSNTASQNRQETWATALRLRLGWLPLVSAPLIKAMPHTPRLVVIDDDDVIQPTLLGIASDQPAMVICASAERAAIWAAAGIHATVGALSAETISDILTHAFGS